MDGIGSCGKSETGAGNPKTLFVRNTGRRNDASFWPLGGIKTKVGRGKRNNPGNKSARRGSADRAWATTPLRDRGQKREPQLRIEMCRLAGESTHQKVNTTVREAGRGKKKEQK